MPVWVLAENFVTSQRIYNMAEDNIVDTTQATPEAVHTPIVPVDKVEVNFIVHGITRDSAEQTVTFNGRDIVAKVDQLTVELVTEDGLMTQVLRLFPSDLDATEAFFARDTNILATFTAA
jgi:hypothetical protein